MNKTSLDWSAKAAAEFDWSLYEDGYDGTNLVHNKKVKIKNKKDRVYCHEAYAQELYDMMEAHANGQWQEGGTKDLVTNSVVQASNIQKYSDHEIIIETNTGASFIIDMNKEHEFINAFTDKNVSVNTFVNALDTNKEFRESLINNGVAAKQLKGGRLSLWDGHLAKIEAEFASQLKNPTLAYKAKLLETNNGGYIVDIQGVRCFMPGSLAAAGIITDFEALVGSVVPVMIVNHVKDLGFIVSYKKYLSTILPYKISTELEVGQKITGKVTGSSKFGVFVQFPDVNGEWVFSGLVHTTTMSKEFTKKFAAHKFNVGDDIELFINNIVFEKDKQRIILSDEDPSASDASK